MHEVDGGTKGRHAGRPRPTARRRRRLLRTASALFVCALGSAPAAALPDLPPVTVPPLEEGVNDDTPLPRSVPTPTTALPQPLPTTAPPPTVAPTESGPTASTSGPTASSGGGRRAPRRAPSTRGRAGAPAAQPPATALVDASRSSDHEGWAFGRLRDASLPAARQFGFPLGLGVVVLGFLALQGRLDGRDPKLATAPVSVHDDLLPFA